MVKLNRDYKRGGLYRDAQKLIIVCEGKREQRYFENLADTLKLKSLEIIVLHEETFSAPEHLLEQAAVFQDTTPLAPQDKLYFLLDCDRPKDRPKLHNLVQYCQENPAWNTAFSNPCFEVWLWYHFDTTIPNNPNCTCSELKTKLGELQSSKSFTTNYLDYIEIAVQNAKATDTQGVFPDYGQTQVYKTILELHDFINT